MENQIICRDMTDMFFGGFQVATEQGILIKWSKRPHAATGSHRPKAIVNVLDQSLQCRYIRYTG